MSRKPENPSSASFAGDGMLGSIYLCDTSAMVDLRQNYPEDLFPNLWARIADLTHEFRFYLHEEVIQELETTDDESLPWIRQHPTIRLAITDGQQRRLRSILTEVPRLATPTKKNDADPWLIAAALELDRRDDPNRPLLSSEICVLSSEKPNRGIPITDPISRQPIPNVCAHYNIRHLCLVDMFTQEKWRF